MAPIHKRHVIIGSWLTGRVIMGWVVVVVQAQSELFELLFAKAPCLTAMQLDMANTLLQVGRRKEQQASTTTPKETRAGGWFGGADHRCWPLAG